MTTETKNFEFKGGMKTVSLVLFAIGAVATGASFSMDPVVGWVNYLVNSLYFVTVALSGIFFLAVTGVLQASWLTPYKRVPEAMTKFLPVGLVLMLVVFFGLHTLYEWTHVEVVANDPILSEKTAWLNVPGFMIRMVLIFAIWIIASWKLRSLSLKQDETGYQPELTKKIMAVSSVTIIAFGLTISVATFDWIMSVEPHWFSTILAVYVFAGTFASGMAFVTLMVIWLRKKGYLAGLVNENHFHDMGKWMFGMSTFWAYIWISQYLLIWYANIPEETEYYVLRSHGLWNVLFFVNLGVNWVLPFFLLMSRGAKRNTKRLALVACIILVGHFLDLYLMVAPMVFEHHHTHITGYGSLQLLQWLGFLGLFLFVVGYSLSKAPLVSLKDPNLSEGAHLHQ